MATIVHSLTCKGCNMICIGEFHVNRRYCGEKCKWLYVKRTNPPLKQQCRAHPMFDEMKAETPAGMCPFCDERRLPPNNSSRPSVYCGDPECKRLYYRIWRSEQRMLERQGFYDRHTG